MKSNISFLIIVISLLKTFAQKVDFEGGDTRNLVYVATKVGEDSFHAGSHPAYTASLKKKLEDLHSRFKPNEDELYFKEVTDMLKDAENELERLSKILNQNQNKYKSLNDVWIAVRDRTIWP
ncbi:MAG: hypothetical protein IT267_00505 [Saprospiraceae bacterium]|nr:hypothetical protein [Saprospiraceae bacterium]